MFAVDVTEDGEAFLVNMETKLNDGKFHSIRSLLERHNVTNNCKGQAGSQHWRLSSMQRDLASTADTINNVKDGCYKRGYFREQNSGNFCLFYCLLFLKVFF